MNELKLHKMIRTFVGYGAPDHKDNTGANKPDYPFFNRLAHQDTLDMKDMVEASERFYKYRNTQLPTLLRDAGLGDDTLEFISRLKKEGEEAKRVYEQQQAILHAKQEAEKKRNHTLWLLTEKRLSKKQEVRYDEKNLLRVAEAFDIEIDEARALMEQRVAEWKPPSSMLIRFSCVDDVWTNRYGKEFTSKRIALHYPYDPQVNNLLKSELGFPACKYDGTRKLWTLQNDDSVLAKAVQLITDKTKYWACPTTLASVQQTTESGTAKPKKEEVVMAVELKGTSLEMAFPYNERLVALVKDTQGRKYNPNKKTWSISIGEAGAFMDRLEQAYTNDNTNTVLYDLYEMLEDIPQIATYMEERGQRIAISGASALADEELIAQMDAKLSKVFPDDRKLYPFQYVGVRFAELAGGRCLIGDDMGVGKTIQAIAHIALNTDKLPALIVAPASVKYNWKKECEAWMPSLTTEALEGRKGAMPQADIIVCNYDIIKGRQEQLLDYGFNIVVCDESHYLKNSKAQRTQATLEIAQASEHILCLSGTAITNRPNEFFTTLNLLRPNEFPSFFNYGITYCDGQETGFGWDFNGASNTEELHHRTRDFCIRRLKKEVLDELPDKVRTINTVQPSKTNLKRYNDLHRAWLEDYEMYAREGSIPKGFVLNMLTALRHECGLIKVDSAVDYIKEYNNITGKPIVVFAHHRDVLKGITLQLKESKLRVGVIVGEQSAEKRQQMVEAFQANKLDVIVCATVAAKEGITLTSADTVLFVEREWTPAWEEQAEDRVNRIGQESQSVHAVYLSVAKTIDEKFDYVVEQKRKVVKAVLDGGDIGEREGIAKALIESMIEAGDLPADFGKIQKVKA